MVQRLRRFHAALMGEDGTDAFGEVGIRPFTLRFRDEQVEREFRETNFAHSLANVRIAYVIGAALWVVWGIVLRGFLLRSDQTVDLYMRYGVFIPILLLALAISFTPVFRRVWEGVTATAVLMSMLAWVYYVSELRTMPVDFGYVGVILITAFTYTLVRLRFLVVLIVTLIATTAYTTYAVLAPHIFGVKTVLAMFYLFSFGGLGCVAAYRLERFTRLLFVRERQLAKERERSDSLLLNILPSVIVDRLKANPEGGRLAEGLDEVSVLFADAVGFTGQTLKTPPQELVGALDDLFRSFDVLADRYGLEKIKTVGDAYMAVAGAPVPIADHAGAAAEMAIAIIEATNDIRWPSGDPVEMRIGVATGPAVAGVIGQRKFAYDLWGETVNLASRLESHGRAGRILVSERAAERLGDRYDFGPEEIMEVKGLGPTRVRFLEGRSGSLRRPASAERTRG
ncbi:MAG TPA: adenylate/guanylate cyclase domain-containing protein [Actinomycetota bacterium]|nr:adenylate/guanylate cyclase domain-containing protein [Actinomycetota bacterium]